MSFSNFSVDPAFILFFAPTESTEPVGETSPVYSCIIMGFPFPQVAFLKDGIPVNTTENPRIQITAVESFPLTTEDDPEGGLVFITMKIEDLRLSDDADYFCTAENTGAPGNVFTVVSDPSPLNIEREFSA